MLKTTILFLIFAIMVAATAFLLIFSTGESAAGQTANRTPRAPIQIDPSVSPKPAPPDKINAADISELSIETVRRDFYEANSPCRKTYQEYFGEDDRMASADSPCAVRLVFVRETGAATRTLEIRRWDADAGWRKLVIEKSIWTGEITPEQFDRLAEIVAQNRAVENWRGNVDVTISVCKITAVLAGVTYGIAAKPKEWATPMFETFRKLDGEIRWEKAQ